MPKSDEIFDGDSTDGSEKIPGLVTAGERIKLVQPIYPEIEKRRNAGGAVVLCAVISKEGKVTSLDPIASPGEVFSESAMDAVRKWQYRPWLVNGKPTEVDSTITVNFINR